MAEETNGKSAPNIRRRKATLRLLTAGMVLAGTMPCMQAVAQSASNYPSQPIRIVVPYPAGSSTDTIARLISDKLQSAWSQPVMVDNRPGALGTIGATAVAKSKPDGHTVLLTISGIVQAPALMSKLPYDVSKDFAPVTLLTTSPVPFAVPATLPVGNLKEFVAYAKAHPDTVTFGSWGSGSTGHMLGMLLSRQAQLQMPHVPYKGLAPLVTDLVGGQVTAGFTDMPTALSQPRLRVLAISGKQRVPEMPQVPTFTELGYQSFDRSGWYAVFMPAGTPRPVIDKFRSALADVFASPEGEKRMKNMALTKVLGTPEELQRLVQEEVAFYGRTYKELGLELN